MIGTETTPVRTSTTYLAIPNHSTGREDIKRGLDLSEKSLDHWMRQLISMSTLQTFVSDF